MLVSTFWLRAQARQQVGDDIAHDLPRSTARGAGLGAGLDPRDIQHVIDQALEPVRVAGPS
jgi:hypothetical protein